MTAPAESPAPAPPIPSPPNVDGGRKKKKTSWVWKLVVLLAGVALVFLGSMSIVVGLAGSRYTATVSDVSRDTRSSDDATDHNYRVSYRYSVGGQEYSGSYSRTKVYNIATLPHEGSTLTVRCLEAMPWFSVAQEKAGLRIGNVLMAGLGVVLVFVVRRM